MMCVIFGFKNQKSNIQRQLEVSLLGWIQQNQGFVVIKHYCLFENPAQHSNTGSSNGASLGMGYPFH